VSLGLILYRGVTALAEPLAGGVLRGRAKRGKEDARRLPERLGYAGVARPEGPLVWLHAASVGESLSILPLVQRLRAERPGTAVLVTSGTVTSAELLARRLPDGAIHQFAPVDAPGVARRFLVHWRPDLAVFVESELWPNLLLGAKKRGARLALLSARITEDSAAGWRRAPAAARTLLGGFDLILAQDAASAVRLEQMGGRPEAVANLKLVGEPLTADAKAVAALRKAVGKRPAVLAASTHPGEEELIASAVPEGALLIVAPRHPERGEAVEAALQGLGLTTARRSQHQPIHTATNAYIADTLGEMGLLFSVADVAVMGGGFSPGIGGHNPLEPARLGVPVVSGPETFNFAEVYADMAHAGAAIVTEAWDLKPALGALLADPERRATMKAAALAFAGQGQSALDDTWSHLQRLLPA
jgi:3-deoxy-D-manno-octulosonic-acid transferase